MRSLALLACLAAGLVGAASAQGAKSQVSIIQDDALLNDAGARDEALDTFAALGAHWVHVVVRWQRVGPSSGSLAAPGFDIADPAAYPSQSWAALDDVVRGADRRGLRVLLTPSGPVPLWASDGQRSSLWKPNAKLFGRFVGALGTRYSGSYLHEGTPLPRVSRWSVWNEPNQPGWLRPQFVNGRAWAPHRYRALFRAADSALRRTGHGLDPLLLGETAPLGDRGTGIDAKMRPGRFLREVFCLGTSHPACDGHFARLSANGLAHHPYVKFRNQTPHTLPFERDDYPIGATSRLIALLNRAGRAGRVARRLPVYFTEFGWQSNPPDDLFGVGLATQAAYINEAERIAYNQPRVRSTSQYLLDDEPDLAGFQTGLRFQDGRPKPALAAYRVPLTVIRHGSRLRIWGLVRPAQGGIRQPVRLLHAAPGKPFRNSGGLLRTSRRGYFSTTRVLQRGRWRVRWRDDERRDRYSRVVTP